MKLRKLIDRLEELSMEGRNDDLDVEIWSSDDSICEPIKEVWIDRYISPNDEYDHVIIEIE